MRAAAVLACAAVAPAAADDGSDLRIRGMTFVGNQGASAQLVLDSERAIFHPGSDRAELEKVRAVYRDEEKGESFAMTCDRAELDVETNDFVAAGNVRGVTADGQHYAAPVVRYRHAEGLLHSDERVTMRDDTGSFEADGFRYLVREERFKLLGNVRVVQKP